MFSRDIKHYASTPRRLDQSKFGPYARLTTETKQTIRDIVDYSLCIACAVAIGVLIGMGV